MRRMASSLTDRPSKPPGFMRFLQRQTSALKKTGTIQRFVHACCIHTHMDYKRITRSGCLEPNKNSGRVARWRFKRFAKGLFFTDAQAL